MATICNAQDDIPSTIADKMLFYHLCELFENIRNMKGRNKKNRQRACLSRYISRWRPMAGSGNTTISSSVINMIFYFNDFLYKGYFFIE